MKKVCFLYFIIAICITACKKPVNTTPVMLTDSVKTDPPEIPKPVVKPDSIVKVVYSGEGMHRALDHPNTFHKTFPAEMTVTINYTDSTIAFQGSGEIAEAFSTWFKLNKDQMYRGYEFVADSLYAYNGITTGMGGEWYNFKGAK